MICTSELASQIVEITRGNSIPFVNLPLPTFFLLYTKKIGKLKQLDSERLAFIYNDKDESDELLLGLYGKFMSAVQLDLNGKYAYRSLISFLNSYDDNEFNLHYCDLIESLLTYLATYTSRSTTEFVQPANITRFVGEIIHDLNPKSIYNPFSGLSSYCFVSDCDYYGQEINYSTLLLAQLRLDAHNRDIKSIRFESSLMLWDSISADCLVSTPPFGMNFKGEQRSVISNSLGKICRTLEEFVLYNFMNSPMQNAVLILPAGISFRMDMLEVRDAITRNNMLDTVVKLPSGIFYGTGISTVVVVLEKNRDNNKVTFVDGSNCIVNNAKAKDLDVDSVLKYLYDGDAAHKVCVGVDEIFDNNLSWDASSYMTIMEELEEGKIYIPLSDVLELSPSITCNDETGIVLKPTDFSDNISVLFEDFNPEQNKITPSMKAYKGCHIVLSALQNKMKLCICNFDEPFYLNQNQVAFSLKVDSRISLEYVVYAMLNSKNMQRLALMMNGVSMRVTRQLAKQILDCKVAIHSDVTERDNTIVFAREEYTKERKNAIQAEMQRLGIRDASSDLSHVLGASFHKINTAIDFMQGEDLSQEAKQILNSIRDNFMYMKRMITTVGVDFETQRVNMQEINVNSFVGSYTESWNNLGYSVFELTYRSGISDDVSVKIDEDMFRVIFDTILRNAYKHGFGARKSSDNKVDIETSLVTYNEKEYVLLSIANNGKPFPSDLTIEKYIKRGGFAGITGNTGLGGYHVYSIVKRHNGLLNISSSQAWGAIVEILIPVEFYEEIDTDKFEEYGNAETCI